MAARDPDPQCLRPDREAQRRAEIHRLPVDTGMYRRRGIHLEGRCAPGPPRRARAVSRRFENDDPE